MKTRIKERGLLLAVAIATTLVAANLFGSARTTPMPVEGDPIPGVDVSIEQSPGGLIIASTQSKRDGTATFTGIAPGKYVVKISDLRKASNNYNSSKCAPNCLTGATIVSGSLKFSKGKPGKATINVRGTGPQVIVVTLIEGPDQNPKPKTRN